MNAVVRLREWIFQRVNGTEGIPVPGPLIGAEHFEQVYSHPAADGRSRGAGLSDLFWYWLAPGPQMHQEHLEPGDRYQTVARTTRRVLAVPHARSDELATAATRRILDRLPAERPSLVRLRDLFMPVWAEVFHELVFAEACPGEARELIVANADDVVTALKGLSLRHMRRRDRLTRYLLGRIEAGTCPVVLPPPFTAQETAWYLQGAFFNTAVVQMSEAMAHILLCAAGYPTDLSDSSLDRLIDETLRVHPLFGIAHRITSAPIVVGDVTLPTGSVLLFNYLAFQRTGPAADDTFDPQRWKTLKPRQAHFIPYGVTANRACPARGAAPVMLRAATREVLRRFTLASTVRHTRSLPSRGPAYLTPIGRPGPTPGRLLALRRADAVADAGRSVKQLVLGTWMVLDARRRKLCATYFEEARP
ncbi:cytochrome P450 [Actinoplanes philippinensis]|uniref:Cytochrome P450 n=1 Tax=Actinoplanes philippinensis TaxID=35752 RepID=A0A1I2I733_9ACTN|nr:cytochrome P450 [Actinoplanes philippinensis]GIE78661.1 cytochrome P450 [Actinoplanes philippinensis]SFF36897.1 Cytochrome P450 [Actinoplanes philippinensis]